MVTKSKRNEYMREYMRKKRGILPTKYRISRPKEIVEFEQKLDKIKTPKYKGMTKKELYKQLVGFLGRQTKTLDTIRMLRVENDYLKRSGVHKKKIELNNEIRKLKHENMLMRFEIGTIRYSKIAELRSKIRYLENKIDLIKRIYNISEQELDDKVNGVGVNEQIIQEIDEKDNDGGETK